MTSFQSINAILDPYKKKVENLLKDQIQQLGPKTPLRDACEYALLNGGKRFRPALVLMVANALGHKADVSEAALCVEYFHTASLIADDLPCMDNDDMRREKPSSHKMHGESTALLSTYALISAGYGLLAKNAHTISRSGLPFAHQSSYLCTLALENAAYNTGIFGATGGQYLDINPPDITLDVLKEIIHKKTVTLFEISFVLGWIFGGGNLSQLDLVKECASHFGFAFQIADDLGDMKQDQINQRKINTANIYGKERAIQMFHGETQNCKKALKSLNLNSNELECLLDLLSDQVARL